MRSAPRPIALRWRLEAYYERHNPERVPEAGALADKWLGRERTLFKQLRKKYGEWP